MKIRGLSFVYPAAQSLLTLRKLPFEVRNGLICKPVCIQGHIGLGGLFPFLLLHSFPNLVAGRKGSNHIVQHIAACLGRIWKQDQVAVGFFSYRLEGVVMLRNHYEGGSLL